MRMANENIPLRIEVPGAKARQQVVPSDAAGYVKPGREYVTLARGTDIGERLLGLEESLCQWSHLGRNGTVLFYPGTQSHTQHICPAFSTNPEAGS